MTLSRGNRCMRSIWNAVAGLSRDSSMKRRRSAISIKYSICSVGFGPTCFIVRDFISLEKSEVSIHSL